MSKPIRQNFTCPCGQTFEADVFKSANVTLHPELKAEVRNGRFNQLQCPSCRREIDAGIPFLYHDMAADLMVWVYPPETAAHAKEIREKVKRSYEIVGTVLPSLPDGSRHEVVFGLDELLPLIDTKQRAT